MNRKDTLKLWTRIDEDLDRDCPEDLNRYLETLGVSPDAVPESLTTSAPSLVDQAFDEALKPEQVFEGKYRILRPLDSGGQSDIYLAERSDGVYRQTVVVKFIANRMDYAELNQQFLSEMQLLADLDHPGVVPLIDGNVTAQGQPWLILDYIDGPHIDHYCLQHDLSQRQIVPLLINLCDTLAFVHQRGVLHKDIKPSNILIRDINGIPHPVLIDFGIASAERDDEDALPIFGTLGYSSPEQLRGDGLDGRSDLYSLGVLMARLLCLDERLGRDQAQIRQQVQDAQLDRDLKDIILLCLAESPDDRYPNAGALRADLDQFSRGLPIASRSHQLSHVLGKSIRRHPWISAALLLAVCGALAFGFKYTRDITSLQQITVQEKNETDALMNFMLDDLFESLDRIGRIDVLQRVAEQSVAHLEDQDPATLDLPGRVQTVKAYLNAGRVFDHLEQTAEAQRVYLKAEAQLQPLAAAPEYAEQHRALLGELRVQQSLILSQEGQQASKLAGLNEAIEMFESLAAPSDRSSELLWEARLELAYHHMEYGEAERAQTQITTTLALCDQALQRSPGAANWLYHQSHTWQLKAWYEIDFGDLAIGTEDVQRAIASGEQAVQADPGDLKKQNNVRILHSQLALFLLESGELEPALVAGLRAIALGDELALKAPFNQEYRREQSSAMTITGEILQGLDRDAAALRYYLRSLAISESLVALDPGNYSAVNDLSIDRLLVAGIQRSLGQQDQASALEQSVIEAMRPVVASEPENKYYSHTLLIALLEQGLKDQARPLFETIAEGDMIDSTIEEALSRHGLSDWLPDNGQTPSTEP